MSNIGTGKIDFVDDVHVKVNLNTKDGKYPERFFIVKNCKGFTPVEGQNVIFNSEPSHYFDDWTQLYLDKPFPRYFFKQGWYDESIAYVIINGLDNNANWVVHKNGSTDANGYNPLFRCLDIEWPEITEEEAKARLDKPKPKFPRYFTYVNPPENVYTIFQDEKNGLYIDRQGRSSVSPSLSIFEEWVKEGYKKEITKEEAEALVAPELPRYFASAKEPWFNNIVYSVIEKDGSFDVDKSGEKSKSIDTLERSERYVKEGFWKEISKEEAEALVVPKFPRYFTGDNVSLSPGYAYIIVNKDKYDNRMICENGKTENEGSYNLAICLDYVRTGSWKEITKEQAEALLYSHSLAKKILACVDKNLGLGYRTWAQDREKFAEELEIILKKHQE